MRTLIAFLIAAASLFGAIEGTVVNRSTGKPQPGVRVTLTKLSQAGMQAGGNATTDAQGRFSIEGDAASAHLLQAVWQGVTYNLSMQSGATGNVELPIFNALPNVSAVEVTQHMVLLETDGKELVVNETVIFQNDSLTTWNNPSSGTARISIPEAAREAVRARVIAPGGLPIERPVSSAGKGAISVDYPVKPGETRFDFSYRMPVSAPVTFSGRIYHDAGPVRIIVPPGIKAEGTGLTEIGVEPSTRATVFDVKGKDYSLTLTGAGRLETAAAEQPEQEEGQRISVISPPGFERGKWWALGLGLAFLALGFWAQYIKGTPGAAPSTAGGKRKA